MGLGAGFLTLQKCVMRTKVFNFSESQFLHLSNGVNTPKSYCED